ncbi:MAG: HEAT repeat domain-containing protein, partial [Planctomycetota bacterium]
DAARIHRGRSAAARDDEVRAEIDEELRFHVDETAAELVRDGWEPAAARTEAARRFGDTGAVADACYRQRNWDRIMLQRLSTGLIALLVVAVVVLIYRGNAATAAQRVSLESMHATIADLSTRNAELLERLVAADAPREMQVVKTETRPFTLPDGSLAETPLERAFVAAIENLPGSPARLTAFGDEAVPYCVQFLNGEHQIQGLSMGQTKFMGANLLGDTGSELAVDPLLAALEHESFNVRRCAALALGKLGTERAIAPLEELAANDPYVYRNGNEKLALVRIDAEKALEMLRAERD